MKKGILTAVLLAMILCGCGGKEPKNASAKDAVLYFASAAQAKNEDAIIMAQTPDAREHAKKYKEDYVAYVQEKFYGQMGELDIYQTKKIDDETEKMLIGWRKDNTETYRLPHIVTVKKINGNWLIENIEKDPLFYASWDIDVDKKEHFNIEPLK